MTRTSASDLLEPLRHGLVRLASHAHAEAIKPRIIGRLQRRLGALPRGKRAGRFRLWLLWSSALIAGATIIGACVGYILGGNEFRLRIEPAPESQVVWSGAVTELRRLTRADSLPARGKLAVLGENGATLVTDDNVEIALGGNTRVSLEALRAQQRPLGLELEQGTLRCDVPQIDGTERFLVRVGATRVVARQARFSVTRPSSDHDGLCVHVESGQVELAHPGKTVRLVAGQSRGCEQEPGGDDSTPVPAE